MSEISTLYDEDFYLWSQEQAAALRGAASAAIDQPIDWENVAEEIESLGRSDRRGLSSQMGRIIEHLLKLEFSRATDPRAGWGDSIIDARNESERVLDDSPSLKRQVDGLISAEMTRGSRRAVRELQRQGKLDPAARARVVAKTYTAEQILGDWFPPEPGSEPPCNGK